MKVFKVPILQLKIWHKNTERVEVKTLTIIPHARHTQYSQTETQPNKNRDNRTRENANIYIQHARCNKKTNMETTENANLHSTQKTQQTQEYSQQNQRNKRER